MEGTRLVERTAQKWQSYCFRIISWLNLCVVCVALTLPLFCRFWQSCLDTSLNHHWKSRDELGTSSKKANDLDHIQICWFTASPSEVWVDFESCISYHAILSYIWQTSSVSFRWEMWKNFSNGFMSEKHFSRIPYHPSTILSQWKICRFQTFLLFDSFFVKIYKKRDWELLIAILTYSFVISTCCWWCYGVSGSTQCCLIPLHALDNLPSKAIRNVQAMFSISSSSTATSTTTMEEVKVRRRNVYQQTVSEPLAHNTNTRFKYHRRRKNSLRLKVTITKEISFLCVDFHALSVER